MNFKETEKLILSELSTTMDSIKEEQVAELIKLIESSNKVFFVGVGRVLLSLEAIAKRLNHLGIDTVVVGQITEPAITDKDLLIVGSGSGESLFPVAIAKKAKSFGAKVVHIGSNSNSSLTEILDLMVRIPVRTKMNLEDEIDSDQLMTSLFEQSLLLLGDGIALMMANEKNIVLSELWQYHANLE